MRQFFFTSLKVFLFFGIGFSLLFLVYKSQQSAYQAKCDLDFITQCVKSGQSEESCKALTPVENCSLAKKIIRDFREANYFWILMVMLAFLVSNVSRAIRWNMLIKPLGKSARFSNLFWSTMAGYFGNMALPRLGEILKIGLITRYEKIPFEKLAGTIVIDRLLDVLCLLVVMALAFFLQFELLWDFLNENAFPESEGETDGISGLIIYSGIALILVLMVILFVFWKKIASSALMVKVRKIVIGFYEGLKTIGQLEQAGWFIFHTVMIWTMYYFMTYMCFFAFAPTAHLGMLIGLVVFVFGSLGIVVPSPGGMGSYQFLVTAALVIFGLGGDDAFSFSMIAFVTISSCNIIFGIAAFIILPLINKQELSQAELPE